MDISQLQGLANPNIAQQNNTNTQIPPVGLQQNNILTPEQPTLPAYQPEQQAPILPYTNNGEVTPSNYLSGVQQGLNINSLNDEMKFRADIANVDRVSALENAKMIKEMNLGLSPSMHTQSNNAFDGTLFDNKKNVGYFNDNLLDQKNQSSLLEYSDGGVTPMGIQQAAQSIQAFKDNLSSKGIIDPVQQHESLVRAGYAIPTNEVETELYNQAKANGYGLFSNPNTNNILNVQELQRQESQNPNAGQTGALRQLGSATLGLATDTAGTAAHIGAYIAKKIVSNTPLSHVISTKDIDAAGSFFDKYGQEWANNQTGYDDNKDILAENNIHNDIQNGNYASAIGRTFVSLPSQAINLIPTLAAFAIGAGEVNVVRAVGEEAMSIALKQGVSKGAAKLAGDAAKKEFLKTASVVTKTAQLARTNAGLLTLSANATKVDAEAYKAKYGEDFSMAQIATSMATNTLTNFMLKASYKDMILPSTVKQIKPLLESVSTSKKKEFIKGVYNLARDAGELGSKMYIQTWGSIVNQNLNYDKSTSDNMHNIFNKSNADTATQAAMSGTVLGVGMGAAHKSVPLYRDMQQAKKNRINMENIDTQINQGFKDQATKDSIKQKVSDNTVNTDSKIKAINEISSNIENIGNNPKLDTDRKKALQIRNNLEALYENGIVPDTEQGQVGLRFGNNNVDTFINDTKNSSYMTSLKESNNPEGIKLHKELSNKLDSLYGRNPTEIKRILNAETSKNGIFRKEYDKLLTSMDVEAKDFMNSKAAHPTFDVKKAELREIQINNKRMADGFKKSPVLKDTIDFKYEDLLGMHKKDIESKLSQYSNKALADIANTARKESNTARKESNLRNTINGSGIIRIIKDKILPNRKIKTASDISKTTKDLYSKRRVFQKAFDPKASPIDTIKKFFATHIKDAKERFNASKTKRNNTKPNDLSPDDIPPKEFAKLASRAEAEIGDKTKHSDLRFYEEFIKYGLDNGHLSKEKYDAFKAKIDARKKTFNDIIEKSKTINYIKGLLNVMGKSQLAEDVKKIIPDISFIISKDKTIESKNAAIQSTIDKLEVLKKTHPKYSHILDEIINSTKTLLSKDYQKPQEDVKTTNPDNATPKDTSSNTEPPVIKEPATWKGTVDAAKETSAKIRKSFDDITKEGITKSTFKVMWKVANSVNTAWADGKDFLRDIRAYKMEETPEGELQKLLPPEVVAEIKAEKDC